MDLFKIFVLLLLGYLLYREFTRKNFVKIEGMNASEAGIEFDSTGIKFNKPTTFDSINVANLTANQLNLLPTGTILMWYNDFIPAGWVECNGENNTPDLRGRFVLGAGQGNNLTFRAFNRNPPTIGGAETHTLTIDEMPKHRHRAGWKHRQSFQGAGGKDQPIKDEDETNEDTEYNTEYKGNDKPHNNMPPFLVLKFIMKQ